MAFTLEDLDRIRVRVGMGTKSLRQMSDTQFTAWLRAQGARGDIGVIKIRPGELMIPIEERVRVLNDLETSGFYIPNIMGSPQDGKPFVDRARLLATMDHLDAVREHLEDIAATVSDLGELDPRVNMRASVHGLIELTDLLRGAFSHALSEVRD
jgi:phosphosulfolactate synthase (CoM biosynthesis protein A)